MKRIKINRKVLRAINMLIAAMIGYIPLIFPEEPIMLVVFIVGLLAIVVTSYTILKLITEEIFL